MGIFSFFSQGNKIKEALKNGAIIIDVRTVNEYDSGRVPESLNIPLDRIAASVQRIKQMNRPVIFCCESGRRSSKAVQHMKENGLKEVYNGGNWMQMLQLLKKL